MGSPQTLHDFVLNLLTNPDARSAFEIDPEGTLREAGLSDISAADVQDVVPLVVDYAPVQGLTSLVPVGDDLGLGQFQLDPVGVIGQLQSVAEQIPVGTHGTGSDINAATLGAISIAPNSLGMVGSVLPGVGIGNDPLADPLGPTGVDVAETLDADVAEPVLPETTGVVDPTGGLVVDPADHSSLGVVDFAGDTVRGTLDGVTGLVDSLDVTRTVNGVGNGLDLDGLGSADAPVLGDLDATSTVTGLTDQVGDTLHGTTSGVLGDSGLTGDEDASTSGGLLGITDGLL